MISRRKRSRSSSPVVDQRRKRAIQWIGLSALALFTAVLVVRALVMY